MSTKTPEEGMEEAAKGMDTKTLIKEVNRLNQIPDRTQGQEEGRKTMQNELEKRGIPVQG